MERLIISQKQLREEIRRLKMENEVLHDVINAQKTINRTLTEELMEKKYELKNIEDTTLGLKKGYRISKKKFNRVRELSDRDD